MAGFNKAIIQGNVGGDPEFRTTQGGSRSCSFSMATSTSWKDKSSGERKEKTQWHKIVVWNQHLIDIIEKYVRKGSKILIEGEIETRKWQDKEGRDNYTTEIVLSAYGGTVVLLDSRQDGGGSAGYDDGYTHDAAEPARGTQTRGAAARGQTSTRQAAPAARSDNSDFELDDEIPF